MPVSMCSRSFLASAGVRTGVAPLVTTCFGPRTAEPTAGRSAASTAGGVGVERHARRLSRGTPPTRLGAQEPSSPRRRESPPPVRDVAPIPSTRARLDRAGCRPAHLPPVSLATLPAPGPSAANPWSGAPTFGATGRSPARPRAAPFRAVGRNRPPAAGTGKRGQQVRRSLERRGRRAVRPRRRGATGTPPPAAPAPRPRHQPPGRRGTYF